MTNRGLLFGLGFCYSGPVHWGTKSVAKIMAKYQLSEVASEKKQSVAA
jgi:hypothetical protein